MGVGGLSTRRLGRLRDILTRHVEGGRVPGLVALVSRRGEVHVETIGAASIGGGPVRRDSIFRIASMTKPITAVATLMLVEECALRLDDPVDTWLPELADRRVVRRLDGPVDDTVPADRPITVRDLLTFLFGFGQPMTRPEDSPLLRAAVDLGIGMGPPHPAEMPAPDEWIRRFGSLPLMYQPGERWMYNTGSDVLGVLVARVAGQPFGAFLAERIFAPLGMVDTGFSVPAGSLNRLVTGYQTDPDTGALEVHDEPGGQWSRPPAFPSGGGGLVSTVDDYLAFAGTLLDDGRYPGGRLLARPTVQAMTADQTTGRLTPAQRARSEMVPGYFDGHGWGFGVSVVTRRDSVSSVPGRYGWDGGLGTSWYNDPAEQLTIVLLTQSAWTSPNPPLVCQDFWTAAYQAIDD